MTAAKIHPSAIIEAGAEIDSDVTIGPFCHIGPKVKIAKHTRLYANVVLMNDVSLGEGCEVFPGAVLGGGPQDLKYKGEPARLEIGAGNIIREHVTMHIASVGGDGVTRIGSNGMFMVGAHVAHDCQLGDKVIMINNTVLGGHVQIADGAMIGGNSAVHQYVRIGTGAMIGGMTGVEGDVIPFGMVTGDRASLQGLNWIGLERRGYDSKQIKDLRRFYKALFEGEGAWADRLEAARNAKANSELSKLILDFLAVPSKRGICLPE